MSFISAMVGTALGAGLGAGISALRGSDPGEGALFGALGGALTGGISGAIGGGGGAAGGSAAGGAAGGSAAGGAAGGSAAGGVGGAAISEGANQGITNAINSSLPVIGQETAKQAATNSLGLINNGITAEAANQAATKAITPALSSLGQEGVNQAALNAVGGGITNQGVAQAINSAGSNAIPSSVSELGKQAATQSWGERAASALGATGDTANIGGKALEGVVYGSGLGAAKSALTGEDIGKGMLVGGLSGGIGGAVSPALASFAGKEGALGNIGSLAAKYPMLTSAGVGMVASPIISNALTSNPSIPVVQPLRTSFTYSPKAYRPYADGGITGLDNVDMSNGNSVQLMASGGISDLGGYSDGGRLLKGPGDGVSDDIPAVISNKQPARLADGEFVLPARIVSELGNGSTEAGAKRLYDMMDRIQEDRSKTMGKGKFSDNPKAYKHLPV
jgi:hypothetical protein